MPATWSPVTDWLTPPQASMDPEAIRRGELTMLNQSHEVGYPPRWGYTDAPKLWQYNLHYMDYLWALSPEEARSLVLDYIVNHPPKKMNCGWEPYPLSLRLMNWCALLYGRDKKQTLADKAAHEKISSTIRLMANWLIQNTETHILANHLLENYLALALVGSCFHPADEELAAGSKEADPDHWWVFGYAGVKSELLEQILQDGGHYERSPMYQCRLLCGLLWLLNQPQKGLLDDLISYAALMANNLAAMTHPDGNIALFNDAALGVYNTPNDLFDFAQRLSVTVDRNMSNKTAWLADSGYAIAGSGGPRGHRFIMDAGELAPSYQPGHAHSDLLSFELSLYGKRVIIDGGNYDYVASGKRAYYRGVKAHNTIEINDQDQCELWSAFRVGRRASPRDVRIDADASAGILSITASHNGYDHLPGHPRHTRRSRWYPRGILLVEDRVESAEDVDVVSRLRLDERWSLETSITDHLELVNGDDVVTIQLLGKVNWQVEDGWYSPQFYLQRPCRVLTGRARGRSIRSGFCIVAGRPDSIKPFEQLEIGGQSFAW